MRNRNTERDEQKDIQKQTHTHKQIERRHKDRLTQYVRHTYTHTHTHTHRGGGWGASKISDHYLADLNPELP